MGHPKRLMIPCRPAEGEMSVGALAQAVGFSQSALSPHPARLKEAGGAGREAQVIRGRRARREARRIMATPYAIFCAPGDG